MPRPLVAVVVSCHQGASPSLLWPNLIDALYALLRAFSEPQHQGASRQWVFGALRDDQVCAALSEEVRRLCGVVWCRVVRLFLSFATAILFCFPFPPEKYLLCEMDITPECVCVYFVCSRRRVGTTREWRRRGGIGRGV